MAPKCVRLGFFLLFLISLIVTFGSATRVLMEDHHENNHALTTHDDKEKQDGYNTVKSQGVGYGVGQGSGSGTGTGTGTGTGIGIGYGSGSGSGSGSGGSGYGYGHGSGSGASGGRGEGIGIGYGSDGGEGNGCQSGGGNCQNPSCGGSPCVDFPDIPIQVPDIPRIPITIPVPTIPDEPCPVVPNTPTVQPIPPATRCVPCSGNCEPEPPCEYNQMKIDELPDDESKIGWMAQEPVPSEFSMDPIMAPPPVDHIGRQSLDG